MNIIAEISDEAFRGDTIEFDIINIKKGGTLVPFTSGGYSYWCTGKLARRAADASALFQVTGTLNSKGQVTAPEAGKLSVKLLPAATSSLPPVVTPVEIDVQFKDALGDVWTAASGIMLILPDVTVSA